MLFIAGKHAEINRHKYSKTYFLAQYGHSQSEKMLGLGDKYHRSIKVHA